MAERGNEANGDGTPASSNGDGGNGRPVLTAIEGGGEPPRSKPRLKKLRAALVVIGLGMLAIISWVFGIMMAVAQDLPSLENRAQYERAENSVMYDRYNNRLATLTNNEGRILIGSEDISLTMKDAVVAIEDERFYEHRGVDFQGIARALYQDVLSGAPSQGASTITQQFVKNALEAQDSRTIFQKLREAALAYQLERQWSKDKILTEYLNSIYFGEGAYGIEAAAKTFFGAAHPGCGGDGNRCASQLLPWEAALLAGIISSPASNSPRAFPDAAKERRDLVLLKMAEQGYITDEEYQQYILKPLPTPRSIEPPADDSISPYFTTWVRQQLVDRYGAGEAFGGGLHVKTSLDYELQQAVESAAAARTTGVGLDTAVVVLDNDTASVLAMVGGFDYANAPFNLATNGQRQPGSSFKPFTLTTALEEGHSTSEVYASAPQHIPFEVKIKEKGKTKVLPDLFEPVNYNDSYLGSASLATATTYSDNSVYAQVGMDVGPAAVAETARKMGIQSDLSSEQEYSVNDGPFEPYNPALILGGLTTGVTTLEMAHAYNTLQEGGERVSGTMSASNNGPVGLLGVTDEETGEPVEDKTGESGINEIIRERVISPETADTATYTLSSVITSGTGKRAQTGEPTWGKTGTTDGNGDAWFCGATPDITACVWVGHADSVTPMETEYGGAPVDGGTIPALIFADVVNAYLSTTAVTEKEGQDDEDEETDDAVDSGYVAPTVEPVTEAPTTDAPAAESAAPADGGGSAGGGSVEVGGGTAVP